MTNLKTYSVYIELIVNGESEEDALEYVEAAIDNSGLLDEDGVVGIEIVDGIDEWNPDDTVEEEN